MLCAYRLLLNTLYAMSAYCVYSCQKNCQINQSFKKKYAAWRVPQIACLWPSFLIGDCLILRVVEEKESRTSKICTFVSVLGTLLLGGFRICIHFRT